MAHDYRKKPTVTAMVKEFPEQSHQIGCPPAAAWWLTLFSLAMIALGLSIIFAASSTREYSLAWITIFTLIIAMVAVIFAASGSERDS